MAEASLPDERIESSTKASGWADICRLCAKTNDHIIPIFEAEGAQHDLSDKIHKYLPIRVAESDTLPIQLCYHCAATILAWHELLEGCLDAQKQLAEMRSEQTSREPSRSRGGEDFSEEVEDPDPRCIDKEDSGTTKPGEMEQSGEDTKPRSQEQLCESMGSTLNVLESEILLYDNEVKNVFCNQCDCCFDQVPRLVEHMRHVHNDHVNQCLYCEIVFRGPIKGFREHVESHENGATENFEGSRNHCCAIGGDGSKSQEIWGSHDDTLGIDEKAKCLEESPVDTDYDWIVLKEESTLLEHSNEVQPAEEAARIDIVDTSCSASPEKIVKVPNSSYMCEFCGKTYFSIADLRTHQKRDHAGLRMQMCDLCERNFVSKSALEYHRRSHTRQRPYKCEYCDKKFCTLSSLYVHRRVHGNRQPYVCKKCEERFSTKECLSKHLEAHKNVSFVCEVCGKSFAVKRNLLRHFGVHTSDQIFHCKYCTSKFRQKRYLRVHMQIHHRDEPDQSAAAHITE